MRAEVRPGLRVGFRPASPGVPRPGRRIIRVEVRLKNHAAKGITDKDFDLAKKIEDVVQWQPGAEGGALEGTPGNQRFAYIKYD